MPKYCNKVVEDNDDKVSGEVPPYIAEVPGLTKKPSKPWFSYSSIICFSSCAIVAIAVIILLDGSFIVSSSATVKVTKRPPSPPPPCK